MTSTTEIHSINGGLPAVANESERREHFRRKTLLAGKVAFNNGWGALDCTVRDISEGGAKIRLGGWLNLPKEIELHLDRGDKYRCERVRFADDYLSVRFLEGLPVAA